MAAIFSITWDASSADDGISCYQLNWTDSGSSQGMSVGGTGLEIAFNEDSDVHFEVRAISNSNQSSTPATADFHTPRSTPPPPPPPAPPTQPGNLQVNFVRFQ